MGQIEATDRYGGNWPDPATVCDGPCEGTGVYPAYDPAFDVGDGARLVEVDAEDVAAITASGKTPGQDGYVFLTCASCGGTGKRTS